MQVFARLLARHQSDRCRRTILFFAGPRANFFFFLLLLRLFLLDDQQRLLFLLSVRIRRFARGVIVVSRIGALGLLVAALELSPLSQLVDHSIDLRGGDVEADVAPDVAFEVGCRLKERSDERGRGRDVEPAAP